MRGNNILVGNDGSGTLTIKDCASVFNWNAVIGFDGGSSGSRVTVLGTIGAGSASTWIAPILLVGQYGTGALGAISVHLRDNGGLRTPKYTPDMVAQASGTVR